MDNMAVVYKRRKDFEGTDYILWTRTPSNPEITLEELIEIAKKEFPDTPFSHLTILVSSGEPLFLTPPI